MISGMRRRKSPWKARLLWLALLLAGLGGGTLYFDQHPEKLPDWVAKTGFVRDLQTTHVYKWQDASGKWHVSDRKPPDDVDYRKDEYARDTNVLPLPPELQR